MDWRFSFWCIGNNLFEFQIIKHAFVELPFHRSALPQLLIIVIETGPVFAELFKAVLIDILDPVLNREHLSRPEKFATYTLLAHLVTLRPSFKQSSSPLPGFSFLHCMKSSLYDLHLAPMKKLSDSNGAELAPISSTAGISDGRGVVSRRVV